MDIRLANEVFNGTDTVTKIYKGDDLVYQFNSELRLIEGTDYELYDWLLSHDKSYINTKIADLTDVSNVIIKYKITTTSSNINLFGRERRSGSASFNTRFIAIHLYSNNLMQIWGTGSNSCKAGLEDTLTLNFNTKRFTTSLSSNSFNSGNVIGLPIFLFGKNSYATKTYNNCGIKLFSIDNVINLVPCKLLHSIPPKLDSQSKYRESGECGMIDTVSGIFYGNANTVGEFTVENDEV